MDVTTAIEGRRSIRRFKPDPVPRDVVREILDTARWAPSWGNTQPWHVHVVAGEALERIRAGSRQRCEEGAPRRPDLTMPERFPDLLQRRYADVGRSVLSSLSIGREDKEARSRYYGDMFAFFEAPCLLLVCTDRSLVLEYALLDLGLLVQNICLLAHERGLGTIALAAAARYPELLREVVPISDEHAVAVGVALGTPDWDSPVNGFERRRADLDEVVDWSY